MNRESNSNKLIVFDGPNKSGKSRQIELTADKLRQLGEPVRTTKEPGGGSDMSAAIRQLLLDPAIPREAKTDTLLFNAARVETVKEIGNLILQNHVLVDRSFVSTLAFQSYGDGAPYDETKKICDYALGGNYRPSIMFILDISFDTHMARRKADDEQDYFERNEAYFERSRQGFLTEATSLPYAQVIDANRDVIPVHKDIWRAVERIL